MYPADVIALHLGKAGYGKTRLGLQRHVLMYHSIYCVLALYMYMYIVHMYIVHVCTCTCRQVVGHFS